MLLISLSARNVSSPYPQVNYLALGYLAHSWTGYPFLPLVHSVPWLAGYTSHTDWFHCKRLTNLYDYDVSANNLTAW